MVKGPANTGSRANMASWPSAAETAQDQAGMVKALGGRERTGWSRQEAREAMVGSAGLDWPGRVVAEYLETGGRQHRQGPGRHGQGRREGAGSGKV